MSKGLGKKKFCKKVLGRNVLEERERLETPFETEKTCSIKKD